jgi:NlpC/P60 family
MTIQGTALVAEVEKFKGFPYVFGAAGPRTFDCSGLVQFALQTLGEKNVPRTSEAQWAWVTKVSKANLQPGDLVFAQFPGDPQASPGHVGVYIGNGQVFSARSPSAGIGVDSLASWGSAIVGYGRPPNETTTAAAGTGGGSGGGILSFPSQITGFFSDANTFVTALMWITKPSNWVRVVAFLGGIALLLFAIHALIAAGSGQPLVKAPSVIPVPV